ncbi:MAG: penicillin-binding protein 2, partial [Ruminococcus sp.]|nr:penicillin-binding protein 2 [Ruminococcus sp.]
QITDYSRKEVISKTAPGEICDLGVKQEYIDDVKKAMLMVTQDPEGTAYSEFSDFPVEVGAKTGTAENAGSDHAAFICYAPFEKPEVAAAVIIEHGANTKFAMRTAKEMLRAYFESKPPQN